MKVARLISDQNGAVLVEVTVMITLTLIFLLGSVDFLFAFYQWNMANKAVQIGARIAAVSDPVAEDLPTFDWTTTPYAPGEAVPFNSNLYSLVCNGSTAKCFCVETPGASPPTDCAAVGTSYGGETSYSPDAMRTIVYGRKYLSTGVANCAANFTNNLYLRGMCHIFPRIDVANVVVTYKDTGLGWAYVPHHPVSTVIVTLQNLPFHFFFLSGLAGFGDINIPAKATSMTGEDLSSTAPP